MRSVHDRTVNQLKIGLQNLDKHGEFSILTWLSRRIDNCDQNASGRGFRGRVREEAQ